MMQRKSFIRSKQKLENEMWGCRTFYEDCELDVSLINQQSVFSDMEQNFEICCEKGGHPSQLCQKVGNEIFKNHAGPIVEDAVLCSELDKLYDAHNEWTLDQSQTSLLDRTIAGKRGRRPRPRPRPRTPRPTPKPTPSPTPAPTPEPTHSPTLMSTAAPTDAPTDDPDETDEPDESDESGENDETDETDPAGSEAEFCWRDTHLRGVGKIPSGCSADHDKLGALCYEKCKDPTPVRHLLDCTSKCPEGSINEALTCRWASYGRGAGYVLWKKGECQRKSGKLCEKHGALWYPVCKQGFTGSGPMCHPHVDCVKLGLGNKVATSCWKKTDSTSLRPKNMKCRNSEEENAGLCYSRCQKNFEGVGPVCWASAPEGWVGCGAGFAKNKLACSKVVTNQVFSVADAVLTVASFGAGQAVDAGVKGAKTAADVIEKVTSAADNVKTVWDTFQGSDMYSKLLDKEWEVLTPKSLFSSFTGGDAGEVEKNRTATAQTQKLIPEDLKTFVPQNVLKKFEDVATADGLKNLRVGKIPVELKMMLSPELQKQVMAWGKNTMVGLIPDGLKKFLTSDVLDNFTALATLDDLDDVSVGVIPGNLQKLLTSDALPQVVSWGKKFLIDSIPEGVKKFLSGEVLQTFTAGATPEELSDLIVGAIPEDLKKLLPPTIKEEVMAWGQEFMKGLIPMELQRDLPSNVLETFIASAKSKDVKKLKARVVPDRLEKLLDNDTARKLMDHGMKFVMTVLKLKDLIEEFQKMDNWYDKLRMAGPLAEAIDPTGVLASLAGIVTEFAFPKCSYYFGQYYNNA